MEPLSKVNFTGIIPNDDNTINQFMIARNRDIELDDCAIVVN